MGIITEGKAKIDIEESDVPSKKMKVFYNPRMKHNRDISVLFYDFWAKEIKKTTDLVFLDGMAASGIKGIRVLTETCINSVIFNDISSKSIENIKTNLKNNKIPENKSVYLLNLPFQQAVMQKRFDIVDLDPFGTPVPFLDFVLANATENNLISVTATDTAVLCGSSQQNSNKCKRIYFSTPVRNESMKETGLRILLGYIARTAAKYGVFPQFLLSYSKDHYLRTFFSVEKYKSGELDKKIGYISFCAACNKRKIYFEQFFSHICECGNKLAIAGPLWLGNFVDLEFFSKLEAKKQEYSQLYEFMKPLAAEQNFPPWHYNLHKYPQYAHTKRDQVLRKIKGVRSHFDPLAVKTNETKLFEKR